jgi:hypothetical protein
MVPQLASTRASHPCLTTGNASGPTAAIARHLGHADTHMTVKDYAHLAPNYVADTIRQGRLAPEARLVIPFHLRIKRAGA